LDCGKRGEGIQWIVARRGVSVMEHEELTENIIGCAFRVYNKMGFGFLESVYEKCLMIELRKAGLRAESQKAITVHYGGQKENASHPVILSA